MVPRLATSNRPQIDITLFLVTHLNNFAINLISKDFLLHDGTNAFTKYETTPKTGYYRLLCLISRQHLTLRNAWTNLFKGFSQSILKGVFVYPTSVRVLTLQKGFCLPFVISTFYSIYFVFVIFYFSPVASLPFIANGFSLTVSQTVYFYS